MNRFLSDMFPGKTLKEKLYIIIFGTDTWAGKVFDVLLMLCIIVSVFITIFESVLNSKLLRSILFCFEFFFTIFFTFEYIARIYCSPRPKQYILSFFGLVDLFSILPFYLYFIFNGAHYMLIIRVFRLIRVFRVFKLFNFLTEGNLIMRSLERSIDKILVFFLFVVILVISIGTIMFAIEGSQPNSEFTSIPRSIYWAIVTLTTVGYGDITPTTGLGQFFSGFVMLLGYTIIAVPTGIVSVSIAKETQKSTAESICPHCQKHGHDLNATYCKYCGAKLPKSGY